MKESYKIKSAAKPLAPDLIRGRHPSILNPQSSILKSSAAQQLHPSILNPQSSILSQRVLIMAAGTGGHIFPALSVAHLLKKQNRNVAWLGTSQGLEQEIVTKENIPLHVISIKGLRGKGFFRWLMAPWKIIHSVFQSLMIIHRYKPDVVLGMGGFVCGPGGIATWLLRKKLVLHEQNAVLGLTNQWLLPFANTLFLGFSLSLEKKHLRTLVVGNPVREDILAVDEPTLRFQNRSSSFRILIFGGSLGAQAINEAIPKALSLLPKNIPVEVWHQTGKAKVNETKEAYQQLGLSARVDPFIQEMGKAYAWADLVISRSGALTVSELADVGIASIVIPYPNHKDQQQKKNAMFLVRANASIMIEQKDLTPEKLTEELVKVLDRKTLLNMAESARSLRIENSAQRIIEGLL